VVDAAAAQGKREKKDEWRPRVFFLSVLSFFDLFVSLCVQFVVVYKNNRGAAGDAQ